MGVRARNCWPPTAARGVYGSPGPGSCHPPAVGLRHLPRHRADRERRLLTAALHLTLARGVPGARPGSCARRWRRRRCPRCAGAAASWCWARWPSLPASSARRKGSSPRRWMQGPGRPGQPAARRPWPLTAWPGTYTLLGQGAMVIALGRQALDSGLGPGRGGGQPDTARSSPSAPPRSPARRPPWTRWAGHLDPDPVRVGAGGHRRPGLPRGLPAAGRGYRGQAVRDLSGSLGLVRRGAALTLGLRAGLRLSTWRWPSTWPGEWDDVLAHRRAGVLLGRDPLPPVRAAAAAPGRGLVCWPSSCRRNGGRRTACPAG